MNYFHFWQKWILVVGIYLVVFGLFLTFFSQSSLMNVLFNNQIDPHFWTDSKLPENTFRFQGWIYGVLGAVMAGWGTLIAFWAYYPFKTGEKWAWNGLAFGTGIWYCTDTTISALYGVTFNIVFNTIMLVLLAAPLVFSRKYFSKIQTGQGRPSYS
ncbi:MAG: hypothetical protein HY879_22040 [Deltaproteobacteria bacterium]|nr:hypothetical protein [Deltaproteobacteria bacterium]